MTIPGTSGPRRYFRNRRLASSVLCPSSSMSVLFSAQNLGNYSREQPAVCRVGTLQRTRPLRTEESALTRPGKRTPSVPPYPKPVGLSTNHSSVGLLTAYVYLPRTSVQELRRPHRARRIRICPSVPRRPRLRSTWDPVTADISGARGFHSSAAGLNRRRTVRVQRLHGCLAAVILAYTRRRRFWLHHSEVPRGRGCLEVDLFHRRRRPRPR